MKLNPEKCEFEVSFGKFLGFLVSQRWIEVNVDKIKDIEEMSNQLPSVKEVQRLMGRMVDLSRFISRSSEICHHFFSLLKKKNNFDWAPKCQQALRHLKRYSSSPQLLSKPEEGENLLIYLVVSEVAGKFPEDPKASWALRTKAARYSFKGGQLYRKSFQGPLARCLGASEANYVMQEVHEGIYGNHSDADSL
uniref:Protein NYNRIN-like n=1 Tax=Nicotiana tabacum TaxID=4097 RepID=A0A1S4A6E8_TOBAC